MAESDPCNICGKLVNRKNILKHIDSHGPKKFRCDICDKRFATKDYLSHHEKTHRKPQDFECHLCSSVFTMKSSLKKHVLRVHEMQRFHCPYCNKDYTKKDYVLKHIERDLSDNELEKCAEVCEQWSVMFPQYFPKQNITRKMLGYSMVLPRFLREKKNLMNTLLRFEQEGEHLHQLLNSSKRTAYQSVYNKPYRYWLMLESYENKLYCTK